MTKSEALVRIKNFEKALKKLDDGIKEAKSELERIKVVYLEYLKNLDLKV